MNEDMDFRDDLEEDNSSIVISLSIALVLLLCLTVYFYFAGQVEALI